MAAAAPSPSGCRWPKLRKERERPALSAGTAEAAPARRVLVVDDNADAAESLAALLELSGHATRVANDGDEAVRIAHEFQP